MKPEAQLETIFRDRVRSLGGLAIKMAPTERGVPDRMAVMPGGRIYLVELKTETGVLSPIQRHWHDRLAERDVGVVVLRGEGGVKEWVRHISGLSVTRRPSRRSTT